MIDAQNNTIIKTAQEPRRSTPAAPVARAAAHSGLARAVTGAAGAAPGAKRSQVCRGGAGVSQEAQRREVAALKGMIEILIEKGVFTREEYLAKIKRVS